MIFSFFGPGVAGQIIFLIVNLVKLKRRRTVAEEGKHLLVVQEHLFCLPNLHPALQDGADLFYSV